MAVPYYFEEYLKIAFFTLIGSAIPVAIGVAIIEHEEMKKDSKISEKAKWKDK